MANKRFDWQTLKEGLTKREILIALILLFAAVVLLLVSMIPVYTLYSGSENLNLQEPYINPPEGVGSNFHVLESNITLTSRDGVSLLDLYALFGSNYTLLKTVYLLDNAGDTVDLESETPFLFVNVTSTSAERIEYRYLVWGYHYPYLLLALPGSLLAFVGIVAGLIGTFVFVAEKAARQRMEEKFSKVKTTCIASRQHNVLA